MSGAIPCSRCRPLWRGQEQTYISLLSPGSGNAAIYGQMNAAKNG
jgi:hypothetical protein